MKVMWESAFVYIYIFCVMLAMSLDTAMSQDDEDDMEEWRKANEKFLFREFEIDEDEREHLKEHLGHAKTDTKDMSKEELEFYYFKTHDLNDDDNLDGLEILKAMEHSSVARMDKHSTHSYYDLSTEVGQRRWNSTYKGLVRSVDMTLKSDDLDKDGYLSYTEFAASRRLHTLKKD